MIDGARRVGKSWIAEEFAKNEYPAYLLIDFATVSAKVKRYFNEYLENLDSFFLYLPLYMAQLLVASCHDSL